MESCRPTSVVAKYGEKSVYFDLEDLRNTTGQWDLYGSDAPSPYNSLQSKFFETFAAPFTKRGLLLKFLILGGGSLLAYALADACNVHTTFASEFTESEVPDEYMRTFEEEELEQLINGDICFKVYPFSSGLPNAERTIILYGSFNPLHDGHLRLL